MLTAFITLIGLHALADYPLQGDFLAKAKNRLAPIPGVPFWQALGAHAAIHALFVATVLDWRFGVAEFVAHALIDDSKCAGRISYNVDQALHAFCKGAWVILFFGVA